MSATDSTAAIGHSGHGLTGCCASSRRPFIRNATDRFLLEAVGNYALLEAEAFLHAPAIRFHSWRPSLP